MEHDVSREAVDVAFNRLDKDPGLYTVELGKVGVEHDLLTADEKDDLLEALAWNESRLSRSHACRLLPRAPGCFPGSGRLLEAVPSCREADQRTDKEHMAGWPTYSGRRFTICAKRYKLLRESNRRLHPETVWAARPKPKEALNVSRRGCQHLRPAGYT